MLSISRLLALPLFLICANSSVLAQKPVLPNVLVILLDDAGYGDFGFLGSPQMRTPHIDALARSGVVFRDAHCTGTTCSPSRAGLMTGRYQQRFGHHNNVPPRGTGMDPREPTMGDLLRAAGLRTIYVGKWHLGQTAPYHPLKRGWDEFFGLLGGSRSYWPKENEKLGLARTIEFGTQDEAPVAVPWKGYLTDVFTDAALEAIDRAGEEPFALFLSYTAPHAPMHAKPEHLQLFQGHPRAKLAAMLYSADEGIGKVLRRLEERKLRENTLIFFLSDNGGAIANGSSNGPLKGFKGEKFEGGQRTPFVVSWPAQLEAGQSFGGLSSALDILPTALSACGAALPQDRPLDGVDLLPYLRGDREGDPHPVLFWHRRAASAVRMGDFKLVRHKSHGLRLYDLAKDLAETRDLRKEHPQRVEKMLALLTSWQKELIEPLWSESPVWEEVKVEIYRARFANEEPHYTGPGGMRRYQEAQRKREDSRKKQEKR
jgi:arylsulfatase A-like enzyme